MPTASTHLATCEASLEPVLIPLEAIDCSPAHAARAKPNRGVIARYAECYARGEELPPVELFSWPGGELYYLGDGAHRWAGRERAGKGTILARVWICANKRDARTRAFQHAASANETHGLGRSNGDRRAAIAAILSHPDFASLTDRQAAALCKCGHVLVRLVREELTARGMLKGAASAETRNYKPGARLRGNSASDGHGNIVPAGRLRLDPGHAPDQPVRCPLLDPRGRHLQMGRCRLCAGKGFISAKRYEELSMELRESAAAPTRCVAALS